MLLLKSTPNIEEITAEQKKIKIADVNGGEKSIEFFPDFRNAIFIIQMKNKNIQTVFVAAIDIGITKARTKSP